MRLFRLAELVSPQPSAAGKARLAAAGDLPLVLEWSAAFAAEVNELGGPSPGAAREWIDQGRLVVWDVGGKPAAMAAMTVAGAGVARIGPVYTPPDQRRRGYAGAVTVAVSQLAADRGAEQVVLFSDLANPTSNALYQRIGYRPVEDRLALIFESAARSA